MTDEVKEKTEKENVKNNKDLKNKSTKQAESVKESDGKKTEKKVIRKVKAKLKKKESSVSKKDFDKVNKEFADVLQKNLELSDKYMRTLAEFENFKKRSLRDVDRSIELQSEKLLMNFVPLVDDLDRAMKHGEDEKDIEKLLDGFRRINTRYMQILKVFDVEPFDSVGEEFNPDRHDALMTRVEEGKEEDIVLEEFEKGFMRGDKILRHAKVIVSKKD